MTNLSRILPVLTLVIGAIMTADCARPYDADIDATVEARIQATVEARLKTALPIRSLIAEIAAASIDSVREMLDAGIDPNKNPIPGGFTPVGAYPLHLAVVKGNEEIVKMLLAYGVRYTAEPRIKTKQRPCIGQLSSDRKTWLRYSSIPLPLSMC